MWGEDEIDRSLCSPSEDEGRWFGGFRAGLQVACMRIDTADPIHWPDDPPGEALYIHKVAVARSVAGQGWPARLLAAAARVADERRARFLRLDTAPREALIRVYQDLGFDLVDDGPRQFAGRELVRLERRLLRHRTAEGGGPLPRARAAAHGRKPVVVEPPALEDRAAP
jgi:GNAT superfamily N-acetyltransferase